MMSQKELEVQRALGTLDVYWIEIEFPRREEPMYGLDRFMNEIFPYAERYYGGGRPIFRVEAAPSLINSFTKKLDVLVRSTRNYDTQTCVRIYNDDERHCIIADVVG